MACPPQHLDFSKDFDSDDPGTSGGFDGYDGAAGGGRGASGHFLAVAHYRNHSQYQLASALYAFDAGSSTAPLAGAGGGRFVFLQVGRALGGALQFAGFSSQACPYPHPFPATLRSSQGLPTQGAAAFEQFSTAADTASPPTGDGATAAAAAAAGSGSSSGGARRSNHYLVLTPTPTPTLTLTTRSRQTGEWCGR
jgi:hypothetical protein